ncbi:MAG: CocE/NonD family hydrolase [Candidatus Aminicenantes bacterium]|nr:MAG: CocE/NonD family hydrolase [Candidatus Aminicenantes bacterium]
MKNLLRKSLILVFCCVIAASILAEENKNEAKEIEITLDQKIRMKDGVHLVAKIWRPANMNEPLPAIFVLTPYVSDEAQQRATFFVQNGYVFVSVDCRGRGNSEGEFYPFEQDGPDGAQVVEWISSQPWCDGQVAMMGGSYRGMVQWQTLRELPPSLKTIVPTAAAHPGIDAPWPNNILTSYFTRWLGFVTGDTRNTNLFSDSSYWFRKFYKMYKNHLPFSKLAEITGIPQKIFKRWISHPTYDDFWKNMSPADGDYKHYNIPILTITGHFDGDQPGAMAYYFKHMKFGIEEGKEKHYLIMGPYDHAGTRNPRKELGGLVFGDNCLLDMHQIHLEWFDWTLKGKDKPEFLKKRVCYYMMGENQWRYVDRIEEISNKTQALYLSSQEGRASDVFHSGYLEQTPPQNKQRADKFVYDPLKLMAEEKYLKQNPNYYTDPSAAFEEDILIYQSAPIEKDIEVAGYIKLKAYLELDVPDTDFGVGLFEIKPDGTSVFLGNDMMRARYRKSLSKEELVKPGEVNLYEFKRFYFFARKLEKGSRLRLIISSLNSPDLAKNYNSGGVVADETAKDAKKATIRLYHDKKYPSALELPIKE